jgi:hypothetical protein
MISLFYFYSRSKHHDSGTSSPRERSTNSVRQTNNKKINSLSFKRGIVRELKTVLDNQVVGQKVVNDELVDLKTQIALLQSSNEPEP